MLPQSGRQFSLKLMIPGYPADFTSSIPEMNGVLRPLYAHNGRVGPGEPTEDYTFKAYLNK